MKCEQCSKPRVVMIAMMPGHDKKPWSLCSRCWRECFDPMSNVRSPETASRSPTRTVAKQAT